jgi:glycosyltransferase involved in cell wall biosynthesis
MRILFITDGIFPFVIGGMQKHSYYLAKYLSIEGIEVELVHVQADKNQAEPIDHPDFSEFDHSKIKFKAYQLPKLGKLPGHYVRENKALSEQIFKDYEAQLSDFDLIYTKGFLAYAFVKAHKAGRLKVPVTNKLHGYEMFQVPPSLKVKFEHMLLRGITKYVTLGSDYIFSYGGKITELIRSLGVPKERIFETPSGIEAKWVRNEPIPEAGPTKKFVFLGRFERRKGVIEINQVLQQLIEGKQDGFEFHFVGPIPENHRVQSDQITYHGTIMDQDKLRSILYSCDVLVCPSYSEGMPNVIMEGMASGLAIIGTDVGAVSEQVSQENGWLLSKADAGLLKVAMLEAIEMAPTEMHQKKQASIDRIRSKFLWQEVVKRKIAQMAEAIEAHYQ